MLVLAFPKKRELFSNSPDWREEHPVFHGISGRKAGISIPESPDGSASEPFGKKKTPEWMSLIYSAAILILRAFDSMTSTAAHS